MKFSLVECFRDLLAAGLAPQSCVLCGADTQCGCSLCPDCAAVMRRDARFTAVNAAAVRCAKCGRPLVSAVGTCYQCKADPSFSFVDSVLPLFPYSSAAQELLCSWKIEGLRGLTPVFSSILADVLSMAPFEGLSIVPVPPRPGKIRDRGWDQIEDIAVRLSRSYGFTVARCLERSSSIAQKTLNRTGRQSNLKGRISMRDGEIVPQGAVVLDDLMTTGSTLDSCAETLKNAGCRKVYGLTLFFD